MKLYNRVVAESPNRKDGVFINKTPMRMHDTRNLASTVLRWLIKKGTKPMSPLPVERVSAEAFCKPIADLMCNWLGHSSVIIEVDGVRLLTDPVFGNGSPVPFSVDRFQPSPLALEDARNIDAVLISHDHYDHLEKKTVQALAAYGLSFFVPLGVGERLQRWGCPLQQITEFDWWDSRSINGVTVTATPSRHYSGRSLRDRSKTLWVSWAVRGEQHSVFFGGDGGYDTRFREIHERLGAFDVTMLEVGAWDECWADIHMFPEQAVRAHTELGGSFMLPIHWGVFDLAMHRWDEPIKRTLAEAEREKVCVITPKMGQPVIPGKTVCSDWWSNVR